MVNSVTANHFCLNLPAAFTQPGDHLLAEPYDRQRLRCHDAYSLLPRLFHVPQEHAWKKKSEVKFEQFLSTKPEISFSYVAMFLNQFATNPYKSSLPATCLGFFSSSIFQDGNISSRRRSGGQFQSSKREVFPRDALNTSLCFLFFPDPNFSPFLRFSYSALHSLIFSQCFH